MLPRLFTVCTLTVCVSVIVSCKDPKDSDAEIGGDSDTQTSGDSESGESGDGDVDECEMLAVLDALIPGDCRCVDPGEPCVQGCFIPDDMTTCDQVCAQLGETCVTNGCGDGWTYLGPAGFPCPGPSEYGTTSPLDCAEPVPAPDWDDPSDASGVRCCCTQTGD